MNSPLLMKKSLMLSMTTLLILVLLLSTGGSAMARENNVAPVRNVPTAPSQAPGPTDPAELEAFLDELLAQEMEEFHIAGAAISLVKDGELFFAKGYGYADIEKGIPVDPEQTVFGVGSVGKTFTWTAVMQLVEQGKLDLDADINTYLDFQIPDTYPQPITLKHLMTHTSGFENRLRESAVSDASELVSAREWIVSNMHARVRPPGEAAGYSNFNAILAGYIVARVSGQPYEEYMQEHIFDPLGMLHTAAQSPVPPDLRPHLSVGYTYADGVFQAFPNYIYQPAVFPSGIHHASVTDMARFMIAHLQDGHYSDAKIAEELILKESTMKQMHTTLYAPDPRLLGNVYGFFDFTDNGQRTLGHIGELPPTHSLLLLLPDQNLGVFVVYNSAGATELPNQHLEFQRAFFDHYYPAPAVQPIQPAVNFAERAGRFVGSYRSTSRSYTTLMKIAGLFSTVEVSDPSDDTLLLTFGPLDWRFVEVEPLYFHQVDGPFFMIFREDNQGRITSMSTDLIPQFAFEKLDWYETLGFNMVLLLGCLLVFLSMLPIGLVRFIRNRRLSGERNPASRGARVAHSIILGICVLNLSFVVGNVLWLNTPNLLSGTPLITKIVLGLGVLAALLSAFALVYTVLAWRDRYWGIAFRLYYTLVTVSALAFVWFLNYWNLLGWRY
jgi:CubicO group peptidase (beta-lactamase class C family)